MNNTTFGPVGPVDHFPTPDPKIITSNPGSINPNHGSFTPSPRINNQDSKSITANPGRYTQDLNSKL